MTTDLAILDEAAADVRLEIDLDRFPAVRTDDGEEVVHYVSRQPAGSR
jgi:hypothetical protein